MYSLQALVSPLSCHTSERPLRTIQRRLAGRLLYVAGESSSSVTANLCWELWRPFCARAITRGEPPQTFQKPRGFSAAGGLIAWVATPEYARGPGPKGCVAGW